VGFAGLAVAAVTIGMLFARRPPAVASLRFAVATPNGSGPAATDDGYAARSLPGRAQRRLRRKLGRRAQPVLWSAEEGQSRRLEGTVGATAPFLSPTAGRSHISPETA